MQTARWLTCYWRRLLYFRGVGWDRPLGTWPTVWPFTPTPDNESRRECNLAGKHEPSWQQNNFSATSQQTDRDTNRKVSTIRQHVLIARLYVLFYFTAMPIKCQDAQSHHGAPVQQHNIHHNVNHLSLKVSRHIANIVQSIYKHIAHGANTISNAWVTRYVIQTSWEAMGMIMVVTCVSRPQGNCFTHLKYWFNMHIKNISPVQTIYTTYFRYQQALNPWKHIHISKVKLSL
jgi:hypothetical protein